MHDSGLLLDAEGLQCLRHDEALFAPVAIRLGAGDLLVVEGRNGAGKTTLLRALLGLGRLQADRLCHRGRDVLEQREVLRAACNWLGHLLALKGELSVLENLRLALALADEDLHGDPEALLERVGLAGYEDTPARSLSAGQRKRAALARLAASRRPLWLLDEPFANLDRQGMDVVESILAEHLARGGAAILTSHGVLPIRLQARQLRLEALH